MSKRKRDGDNSDEGERVAAKDYRRQRQIVDTFAHSAKQLAAAFKLARGFERQKLGRRKKIAAREKNEQETQRIDAEVAALKKLDPTASARNLLAKSLLKIKAVATHPNLPDDIGKLKPLSTETATLNVHARLCNSNPVREAFPVAVTAVKREFGIREDISASPSKKRKRAKDYAVQDKHTSSIGGESDDESDLQSFDNRLASLEDESDASEDEGERSRDEAEASDSLSLASDADVQDLERLLEEEGVHRGPEKSSRIHTRAPTVSPSSEAEVESELDSSLARPTSKAKTGTFIPSLTMGGYISGGDSEIEDLDDSKPKKNRRGQRARQAIWEKKYGSGAKHIKEQDRKQGWDAKRGAIDGNSRHQKGQSGARFAKAANALPLGRRRDTDKPSQARKNEPKKSRDDSGPLHPSWAAAKLAKEKKSVPVVFTGKKISFD
ncbi:Protein bud22 [Pseudocercospora fuligena]|uniref:Protein bud22 n=1 Tax=Pseudocercospora fuligena TaxID=685502 RepID=A0A8H6RE41_9PEZI|nr:Protein bud22 [Pseudocercospora fuligena]